VVEAWLPAAFQDQSAVTGSVSLFGAGWRRCRGAGRSVLAGGGRWLWPYRRGRTPFAAVEDGVPVL